MSSSYRVVLGRVVLGLAAFSLSFDGLPLVLVSPSSSVSAAAQATDEDAVRMLTLAYGAAIAAGELERMRGFWNPQASGLTGHFRAYQGLFANQRIEFINPKLTRLEITGDRAVSHLTADERRLDKQTGAVLSELDLFHGACRVFEWGKAGDGWKLESVTSMQEVLAAKLVAAASESERETLLEKEREFVTDFLPTALGGICGGLGMRGDSIGARRCYQLQLTIAERIGAQSGLAGGWLGIAQTQRFESDYEQALSSAQKALAIYEAARLPRGVAHASARLSIFHRVLGNYQQAFACAQRAVRLYEEARLRRGLMEALKELAELYSVQNNYAQALAYFERSLALAQELGDKIEAAILRIGVASLHMALGEHEQARLIYQDLLKQTASRDRGGAANLRIGIGSTYAMQGRYQEALDYSHQALAELEALGNQELIALALENLTEVYLAQGRYADALPLAERVVAWWRQTNCPLDLWFSLKLLGESQLGLQRPAEARRSLTEAISLIEKLREQTAGGVEERQRYLANRVSAHHLLLGLLAQERQTREALTLAEAAKARVLLDVLQQGKVSIQKTMTPAEREQEQKLNAELTRLNMQLTRADKSDQPGAQARLDKARLEYEAFRTALYAAHPLLQAQRGEAPVIKGEELAALLPDAASALLEYVVTDNQTFLFVGAKAADQATADIQIYKLPIKRGELGGYIEAFRQQLAARDLGFRATATKLYDLLLKPAQAQLKDKTNLVIIPDDKLWELPFQALSTGANRYLIEDAALSYAPSLTVLREMTKRQKPRDAAPTLLALGNPALGQETIASAALTSRAGKLDPLPEAEAEVKALGRLYGAARSKVYTGGAASEDRVKAEAAPIRVLHFATHGVLNNAAPLYSSLALTQSDNEDGLLEAWELMRMDLQADLVVLSACETARGRFGAGEGIIGLTWALFIAGAPSTVVSQWKVESAATRELMVSFHRQLRPGATQTTKAEALRQSALSLLKKPATSHPFYWAGFVLVGDGR